jgi:hypothetical protein
MRSAHVVELMEWQPNAAATLKGRSMEANLFLAFAFSLFPNDKD